MVHRQQTALRAFQGIVVNAVMVHADLRLLFGGCIASIVFEGVVLASNTNRVTPGRNHVGHIALGHGDAVGRRNANAFEAHFHGTHAKRCTTGESGSAAYGAQGG